MSRLTTAREAAAKAITMSDDEIVDLILELAVEVGGMIPSSKAAIRKVAQLRVLRLELSSRLVQREIGERLLGGDL